MKKIIFILLLSNLVYAKSKAEQQFLNAIRSNNNSYAKSFIQKTEKKVGLYDVPISPELEEEIMHIDIKEIEEDPLLIAAESNNLEMFELLLKKGLKIDKNSDILIKAIQSNSTEVAIYIIENFKYLVNKASENDGWLPIEEAVLKENKKILEKILQNGGIIRLKDKNGYDVYDLATKHGKAAMVIMLRKYERQKK